MRTRSSHLGRAAAGLVVLVGLMPSNSLGSAERAARDAKTHVKSYDVTVTCSPPSSVCPQEFRRRVKTSKVFKVEFIASPINCTPISVGLFGYDSKGEFLDGGEHFLNPGQSSGRVSLSGGKPGRVKVGVGGAQDLPGGSCPDGPLTAWGGKLKVTTSR